MAKRQPKRGPFERTMTVEPVIPTLEAVPTDSAPEDPFSGLAYAIASQEVLAQDWLTPEDDIDWNAWIIPDENEA